MRFSPTLPVFAVVAVALAIGSGCQTRCPPAQPACLAVTPLPDFPSGVCEDLGVYVAELPPGAVCPDLVSKGFDGRVLSLTGGGESDAPAAYRVATATRTAPVYCQYQTRGPAAPRGGSWRPDLDPLYAVAGVVGRPGPLAEVLEARLGAAGTGAPPRPLLPRRAGPTGGAPKLAAALRRPPDTVGRDCLAVAPQGSLPGPAWVTAHTAFEIQAEVGPLGVIGSANPPVRVAIVDSARSSRTSVFPAGPTPGELHGRTVGRVVESIVCPRGERCLAELTMHPALIRGGPRGAVGTWGDLAAAIRHAVLAWRQDRATAGPGAIEHLVINLSLGWLPRSQKLEFGERAVRQAIEEARCHGALVVAAAGNLGLGAPERRGALLPAAWESTLAPSECKRRFGISEPPTQRAPLVIAAGAIDADGRPLANARRAGLPTLLAPGSAVLPDPGLPGGRTQRYTGSSISAAIVSAAAAVAWALEPARDASGVAQRLVSSAQVIDDAQRADFCLGDACPARRKLTACAVARAVCAAGGPGSGRCRAGRPPTCAGAPGDRGARKRWTAAERAALEDGLVALDGAVLDERVRIGAPCHRDARVRSDFFPARACPDRQSYGLVVRPEVYPQPPEPVCPDCVLFGQDLYITVSEDLVDVDLVTHGQLVLWGPEIGEVSYDLHAIQDKFVPGQLYKITGLPIDTSLEYEQAAMVFELHGAGEVFSTFDVIDVWMP